jgi:hypothetical protein
MVEDAGMVMELKATRSEFELSDPSGYKFKIVAEQHVEGDLHVEGDRIGTWAASVTMSTDGYTTAEAAVLRLRTAAEHFVRMLKEARDGES